MTSKIYFLKGLPASGKSTWAKQMVQLNCWNTFHVTKDQIRLENPKWSEKQVVAEETRRVRFWLEAQTGKIIIIDNTHFNPVHEERYRKLAEEFNADFEVVDDFLKVPLEECIRRDNARADGVGESVIKEMWRKHIRGENPPIKDPAWEKPWCMIVDIDGTLADHRGIRNVYDKTDVTKDSRRHAVCAVVEGVQRIVDKTFILSGRNESTRAGTTWWLEQYCDFNWLDDETELILRPDNDNRPDYVFKKEVWEQQINSKEYQVIAVFEDRPRNVRMWQSLGLPVFCCNEDYDNDF